MYKITWIKNKPLLHCKIIKYVCIFFMPVCAIQSQDTQLLKVDEWFQLGIENTMQIKPADLLANIVSENKQTAQTYFFPQMKFGVQAGVAPYPILFAGKRLTEATQFTAFPIGKQVYPLSHWSEKYPFQRVSAKVAFVYTYYQLLYLIGNL